MIAILLAIIALQMGIITIGLGTRLVMDAVLIRETLAIKNRPQPQNMAGIQEITLEQAKALGLDVSKFEKENAPHGQYV